MTQTESSVGDYCGLWSVSGYHILADLLSARREQEQSHLKAIREQSREIRNVKAEGKKS